MDSENYPLSSPKGDSIPFDIGFPYGLFTVPLGLVASDPYQLPEDATIAVLHASCDCIICFGSTDPAPSADLTEGAFFEHHTFVPAGGILSIQVPDQYFSVISSDGVSTGKLRLSLFKPWQSIGKDLLTRKM